MLFLYRLWHSYNQEIRKQLEEFYTKDGVKPLFFIDPKGDFSGTLLLERPTFLSLFEPEMESISLALRAHRKSGKKWKRLSPWAQGEVRRLLGQVPFSVGIRELRAALAAADEEAALLVRLRERCLARLPLPEALIPVPLPEKVEIAGLPYLRAWIHSMKKAFTQEAYLFELPKPRGLFLIGPPGTGKGLAVHYLAQTWNLPLFRLDVGALLGRSYGTSEANYRKLFSLLNQMPTSILWLDYLESLKGRRSTLHRWEGSFFSYLFHWMDTRKGDVFVVATANNIDHLPPELLRRGRFDEWFFVDLPGASQRRELWELFWRRYVEGERRRGAAPPIESDVPWEKWVEASRGFSGAEIEQVFKQALQRAWALRRPLQPRDVEIVLEQTVPQAVMQRESIQALRRWVLEGLIPPAGPLEEEILPYTSVARNLRPPSQEGLVV